MTIERYRTAILAVHPELSGAPLRPLPGGWHSQAIEADGRLVFKFPRSEEAERALRREASILAAIRPHVTMRIPDLTLHETPVLFSEHRIVPGEHLEAGQYEALAEPARQALAEALARFYADLHAIDRMTLQRAGARPVEPWLDTDMIAANALPLLPQDLQDFARQALSDYDRLSPDPHGETYGFFDGHGWNMAFDHATGRLNGVYDFADSGFGPLHQDFIYSNFISDDLTARIITGYERLTGRRLDRARIDTLTGAHRLSELAGVADTPEHHAMMIDFVARWAATTGARQGGAQSSL